jgi:hypothetical protein
VERAHAQAPESPGRRTAARISMKRSIGDRSIGSDAARINRPNGLRTNCVLHVISVLHAGNRRARDVE